MHKNAKKLRFLLPFLLSSLICSIEVFLQRHVGVLRHLKCLLWKAKGTVSNREIPKMLKYV